MKAVSGVWACLSIVLVVASVTGCLLDSTATGRPPTYDADLRGCFRHRFDADRGRIIVQQLEANLLTGHGQGLGELGPTEGDVWAFVGDVNQNGPPPFAGVGVLHPTWRTPAGSVERATLDVLREQISASHYRLILQRTDGPDVRRVELDPCP